jgi:hypothetical protein
VPKTLRAARSVFLSRVSLHEELRAAARSSCRKGTKRADHKPLRGRSVARACGLNAPMTARVHRRPARVCGLKAPMNACAHRRLSACLRATERAAQRRRSARFVQFPGGSARPPEASPRTVFGTKTWSAQRGVFLARPHAICARPVLLLDWFHEVRPSYATGSAHLCVCILFLGHEPRGAGATVDFRQ